jgi:hypothetical protein
VGKTEGQKYLKLKLGISKEPDYDFSTNMLPLSTLLSWPQ